MTLQRNDRGASLAEVLIAVLIMAVFGIAVVAGVYSVRATTDKVAAKQQALTDVANLTEQLQRTAFLACSAATPQPYALPTLSAASTPALFGNAEVSVSVTVPPDSSAATGLVPCTDTASVATPSAALVQMLTVNVKYKNLTLTKSILKAKP